MAKFTIPHTCGHTATVQLLGKMADRDGRAAWLASRPCRECAAREAAGPVPTVKTGRVVGVAALICDENSYHHRAALKAAGYRFAGGGQPYWHLSGADADVLAAMSDALAMGWAVLRGGKPVTPEMIEAALAKLG